MAHGGRSFATVFHLSPFFAMSLDVGEPGTSSNGFVPSTAVIARGGHERSGWQAVE